MDEEDIAGSEEAVRVFVRIRPLNKRELSEKQTIGWNFNETSMLEDTPNGQRVYAYDHCFGPSATNQETYDIVGKPVVLKAMEGYNGTVFTYGQTGSGKTWTMRGNEADPGMMVLCVRDILDWVKTHPNITYTIRICYLEVYNEEINDLLGDPGLASKNLKIISEDAARGAVIGGLVEEQATTADDFMAILQRGEASRSYASTNMNAESSRSHTIYRVTIEAREKQQGLEQEDVDANAPSRVSYLNLVDLAGSERQKSTKAEGKVLKEGANINKSLLALGAVINKLGEASKTKKGAKPAFIPYRDSKLTRILKQSLGGNTLTSVLCAVTPATMHREETVSTLKFGQTCKSIKNNVKSNDGLMDDKTLIKTLRASVAELRTQLEELAGPDGGKKGDPATGEMLSRQKMDYEGKIQVLEKMLQGYGVSQADISQALQSASPSLSLVSSSNEGGANAAEVIKLNDKITEQQKQIVKLQRKLEEYSDLDEMKASFEEYEHHVRQELDEARSSIEEEKFHLTQERIKLLKDRSTIDEKESRIGIVITNLDEKESKLRQLMATMREQQEQWNRSVTDLQRREDLVDDWQRNHKQREKKLLEIEAIQEKKFTELNKREAVVLEEENKARQLSKELSEREQRLQIGLSRIANAEVVNNQKEEQLVHFDNTLKKRVNDCDVRERELLSRRKEMESWDALLREKDRKISSEQKSLDEREGVVKSSEEKIKKLEVQNENKHEELKAQEGKLAEMQDKYEKLLVELDERDKDLKERDREFQVLRKELDGREEFLKQWERNLAKLQDQMKGIESRERNLHHAEDAFKQKEDDFYNVKVAQITARHNQELRSFEEIIQRQLKIATDFQRELEGARGEVAAKAREVQELEGLVEQRGELIDQLKGQLRTLESRGGYDQADGGLGLWPSSPSPHSLPPEFNAPSPINTPGVDAVEADLLERKPIAPVAGTGRAAGSMNMSSPLMVSPGGLPDFFSQLALTKNMLHHVLEKYDALPDSKTSPLLRRAASAKWKSLPPEPKAQHEVGAERGTHTKRGQRGEESRGEGGVEQNREVPPPPPPPPLPSQPHARRDGGFFNEASLSHPSYSEQRGGMSQPLPQTQGRGAGSLSSPHFSPPGRYQPQGEEKTLSPHLPPGKSFSPQAQTTHVQVNLSRRTFSHASDPSPKASPLSPSKSPGLSPSQRPAPHAGTAGALRKPSQKVFGKELYQSGIVAGDYEEQGVPVTVVNLNKRQGIKKIAQQIH